LNTNPSRPERTVTFQALGVETWNVTRRPIV
jgi:hypothetical protein